MYLTWRSNSQGGYIDVYLVEDGQSDQYITRVQTNTPVQHATQTVCIVGGDQYPSKTHVKIIPRKGQLFIYSISFRDNVGDTPPPGFMHSDCVVSGQTSSLSTERVKDQITPLGSDLLLDFCNALAPSMYVRTDIGDPEPRLGLIAERVQEQLIEHALPTNMMGSRFEAVEQGGDIEKLLALDYSRLTMALLGAVKEPVSYTHLRAHET